MLGHTGLFVDRLVKVLFEGSVVLVLCQHELFDDGSLTGCFLLLERERFKINIAAVDRDIERSAAVKELLLVLCGDQLFLLCRQLVVSVQRLLHLLAMLFLHTLGRRKLLDELFDMEREKGGNYLSPDEIPSLLDPELPQQLLVSAFRRYRR